MLVNGTELSLQDLSAPEPAALLEHFSLDPRAIAIERNGQIVPRAAWDQVRFEDGDRVELIRFVGGG